MLALRIVLATAAFGLALSLAPPTAEAGNRRDACGGVGQRACCAHEILPSCDSGLSESIGVGPGAGAVCGSLFGVPIRSAGTCYGSSFPSACGGSNEPACTRSQHHTDCMSGLTNVEGTCRNTGGFPADCGAKDQRACTIFEHIPSCSGDLVELLNFGGGFCREIGGDGFPTHCGHELQAPCVLTEHIPSCVGDLVEFGGQCRVSDDTFPPLCGSEGQRACTIFEHIPSCKSDLVEKTHLVEGNICRRIDSDGFPDHCGEAGEPACQLLEHIPSCKPDAYEILSPELPTLTPGWCVEREDFDRAPFSSDRPTEEVPPGPRSVFLVHGLGGDRNSLDLPELHDPARGFRRYTVDANWSGGDGALDDPVGLRIFDRSGGEFRELCEIDGVLDSYRFSVPTTSRLLKDALLDRAGCRSPEAGVPGGVENVTLVAHSMGGITVRDLVYRHYDELLANGVRIAEVVTLGSPHRGGGESIPEIEAGPQQWALCAFGLFNSSLHQSCLLRNWHAKLREERARRDADGAPYIDNLDFPGIRWVTIAAADAVQPNNVAFSQSHIAHDNLVAHTSAFGIATDYCFPNVDSEAPPPSVSGRNVRNIAESRSWIELLWPPLVADGATPGSPTPFAHNPFHPFDVSPAAEIVASSNGTGSYNARCHGPGPSSRQPDRPYLRGLGSEPEARFLLTGEDHPHGDIVGESDYAFATANYVMTLLTDGLRGADVDGNGRVERADLDALIEDFPGYGEDVAPSAFAPGFEVWSDLNGDGFVDLEDLFLWHELASETGEVPPACGLFGIEPFLVLGGIAALRRRGPASAR